MRCTHSMKLAGHGAIVTDNEILVSFESYGGAFPITGKLDVRFVQRLAINDDFAVVEGDGFAGEPHDPFHIGVAGKGDARVGEADKDNITATGFVKEKGEAIHDVDAVGFVGGGHAFAIDTARQGHKTEH